MALSIGKQRRREGKRSEKGIENQGENKRRKRKEGMGNRN
jgi:hypothetical protein